MKSRIAITFALWAGLLHVVLVGFPFIMIGGEGESMLYIAFVHFPLYLFLIAVAPNLLAYSVAFNFLAFVVFGTAEWALIGYFIGLAVDYYDRKHPEKAIADTTEIYVPLEGEDTDSLRAVRAIPLGENCFRIVSNDPDSEDEQLQFRGEDVVRCKERTFLGGSVGLVAVERVGAEQLLKISKIFDKHEG